MATHSTAEVMEMTLALARRELGNYKRDNITLKEQSSIIRRAAERGLKLAQDSAPNMVDILQHIVDESIRFEKWMNNE